MATAFSAPVALSTGAKRAASSQNACGVRMCARIPGDESAAPSKYSQYISQSRLNKAPLIQLNSFKNEDYNNISVSLVDLPTDIAAAEAVRAAADKLAPREAAPDASFYKQYYDPATVNQAPFIAMSGSAADLNACTLSVAMYDVPLQVNVPQAILEQAPTEETSRAYMKLPPTAPEIQVFDRKDDELNSVYISNPEQHLNLAAAEAILNKYRK